MSTVRKIEIVTRSGKRVEVEARLYAGSSLAVHRARRIDGSWSRWWNITHVESGAALISCIQEEPTARAIACALAGTGILWANVERNPASREMLRHGLGPDLWNWLERLRREGMEREERYDEEGEA